VNLKIVTREKKEDPPTYRKGCYDERSTGKKERMRK